jgi:hypothetical protein
MKPTDYEIIRNKTLDEVWEMVKEVREGNTYDPVIYATCRAINVRLNEAKTAFDPTIFSHPWAEVKHFTDLHYTVVAIVDNPAIRNRVLFLAYKVLCYEGEPKLPLYGDDYCAYYDYQRFPPTFKLSINWRGSSRLVSSGALDFSSAQELERFTKVSLECHKWSRQLLENEFRKVLHSEN